MYETETIQNIDDEVNAPPDRRRSLSARIEVHCSAPSITELKLLYVLSGVLLMNVSQRWSGESLWVVVDSDRS